MSPLREACRRRAADVRSDAAGAGSAGRCRSVHIRVRPRVHARRASRNRQKSRARRPELTSQRPPTCRR
eukprot:1597793-Pleurochrysis_carterae.AAC.1